MTDTPTTEPDYTEGVCADGAAILCDGVPMAIPDILDALKSVSRLRKGLLEVRGFLNKPEWGTWRYMEGSDVYDDKDRALFNIRYALGEVT